MDDLGRALVDLLGRVDYSPADREQTSVHACDEIRVIRREGDREQRRRVLHRVCDLVVCDVVHFDVLVQ